MGGQKVCTLTLGVAAIGDSAPIMELLGLVLATLVGTLRSRQRLLIEDLFADSDAIRPPVPIQSGHLFRRIRPPLEEASA